MRLIAAVLNIFCTAADAIWIWLLADALFVKRNFVEEDAFLRKWILPICVSASSILILGLNQYRLSSVYTGICMTAVCTLGLLLFWQCDLVGCMSAVGCYFFFLLLMENIHISVMGFIGGEELLYKVAWQEGPERAAGLLVHGLLVTALGSLALHLVRRKVPRARRSDHLFPAICVGYLGASFFFWQYLKGFHISVTVGWYVFLFFFCTLLVAGRYLRRQKEHVRQMELLDYQNRVLEKNYDQANAFYLENAKLYHDMHHHLRAIHELLQAGQCPEALRYIESLETISPYEEAEKKEAVHTGINILDAVLLECIRHCKGKGLRFVADVPLLAELPAIERKDLCSLFANLLENAVENAQKEVIIHIRKVNQMLCVTVENDSEQGPCKKGRFFAASKGLATTKGDAQSHGWGTQIIEKIVERYEGDIQYGYGEGRFHVFITIDAGADLSSGPVPRGAQEDRSVRLRGHVPVLNEKIVYDRGHDVENENGKRGGQDG